MDNDDAPIGRILTRREMIGLLGGAGTAFFLGSAIFDPAGAAPTPPTPAKTQPKASRGCIVRPELTEGPFFVDEGLNRSDIRSDPATRALRPGVPLELIFNLSQAGAACNALVGSIVDVWHCDALGAYSDVGQNGTAGQKWLRGSQITNAQGVARFTTIFPGWYRGRAVHIHFKIRTLVEGQTHDFTSQFFFDDALSDKIHVKPPYSQNGQRDLRNDRDGIYQESVGQLMLALKPSDAGYSTTFDLGVDLTRSSSNLGPRRGGPGGRGPGRGRGEDGGPPPPPDW